MSDLLIFLCVALAAVLIVGLLLRNAHVLRAMRSLGFPTPYVPGDRVYVFDPLDPSAYTRGIVCQQDPETGYYSVFSEETDEIWFVRPGLRMVLRKD